MEENIEKRIEQTKLLFGEGIFGLAFGLAFYVLPVITQNTNTAIIQILSIGVMGIGVAIMLFAKHHIKWLAVQKTQT